MYPDPAEPTNPVGEARVPKPLHHAQTQVTRINADRSHVAQILTHILDGSTPADDTINDHGEHDETECICGPTHQPVIRDDGSCGWITIHASLDGREATEE